MPETVPAAKSGLFTTHEAAVPLTGVSIDARVSGACARVAVTQRYVNCESLPIEAVYVFPLDEGAAVCGFEAIVDGAHIVGEVKEREEAFQIYDEAMERGHGAFLLDEERPDVFQASVGNLPPGKEALLKLTYVSELAIDDGVLRLVIPTTVSPRYAPAKDRTGVGRPDAETLNPPVAWSVPYGLSLAVRVETSGAISSIESPSHPVSIAMDSAATTVSLSQAEAALDRDFVLAIAAAGLDAPRAWMERDDSGDTAVAVAFAPRFESSQAPSEIIFLVDRSGSMEGTSIVEVRNALQLCLRSMTHGCAFNIVGFGSTYSALFPHSRVYDESSLSEASAHVRGMAADLGGTEIEPALRFVLDQPKHGAMPRQVVLLTDGEVTNTDEVLRLAHAHATDTRIFTFGIGAGASHHLVKGIARLGRGASEHILPGERIEPKVVRLFGRLLTPALTGVRVEWDGLDAVQAPNAVPPVFSGGRLVVYAFVRNPVPATVRLEGVTPAGRIAFRVDVDPAHAVTGTTIATLAARSRIRELEEDPASLGGSRQHERKDSAVRQQIVRLAVRYGLVSRETSFVAVEKRETPVLDRIQLRRVPIALTAGWGGLHHRVFRIADADLARGAARASVHPVPNAMFGSAGPAHPASPGPMRSAADGTIGWALSRLRGRREPPPPPSPAPKPAPMVALVTLQRADGSWSLTRELADAIGHDLAALEAHVRDDVGTRDEIETAWATALALTWLRDNAADFEDEWRLLAAKARQWLARSSARPTGARTWIEFATAFCTEAVKTR
jgi:Ca-activated chloride channel homolog